MLGTDRISNICISIEMGQTVALVGASGAKKSPVGKLLIGFQHPSAGQILLESVDIRHLITDE